MGTGLALAPLEGNGTLAGFLIIAAAFRLIPAGAFDDFPAIPAEFKISQDILGFPPYKVCGDKAHIFFGSHFFILRTAVGSIRHNRYCFILLFHAIEGFFQKLAVTVDVLLILVILNDAPVFAGCLYDICHIPTVLFPCFFTLCRIRVCRVLQNGCIHSAVFFDTQAAGSIFSLHRLLFQYTQKKLATAEISIIRPAKVFQYHRILQGQLLSFRKFPHCGCGI